MDFEKYPSMKIFESFMYGFAKLMIEEYIDDMEGVPDNIFTEVGLRTTELEDVQQYFLDNWNHVIPDEEKIAHLIKNTIGSCHHIMSTLIPYDDLFQRAACEKVGEIFTEYLLAELEGKPLQDEEQEPIPSTSSGGFTTTSAKGIIFLSKCTIHTYIPIPINYKKFCYQFSNLMYHNFMVLTSHKQKQIFYNKVKADDEEILYEDYLNLYSAISHVWTDLLPTPLETRMLVKAIYGNNYNLIQNHMIPHDVHFRDNITWKITTNVRKYFRKYDHCYEDTR